MGACTPFYECSLRQIGYSSSKNLKQNFVWRKGDLLTAKVHLSSHHLLMGQVRTGVLNKSLS